jgi:hypothetical protein
MIEHLLPLLLTAAYLTVAAWAAKIGFSYKAAA